MIGADHHMHAHYLAWTDESESMTIKNEQLPGTESTATRDELLRDALTQWWEQISEEEIARTIPKAVKYGAVSLEILGEALVKQLPPELRSKRVALQMAVWVYAQGKMARAWASLLRGEMPSHDDWFDMGVYAKMALYVEANGEWV